MKIALIGYGKMGKAIEQIAKERKHEVVSIIDQDNQHDFQSAAFKSADVAIEFTGPESAFSNISACFAAKVPVVCGSTGWLEHWYLVEEACKEQEATILYASNFSIGVNLFFQLNQYLAELMKSHAEYHPSITEIHHTAKKDAPSGTAITLAEGILASYPNKTNWVNRPKANEKELSIISERIDPAPGTHIIQYTSEIDDIEIKHTAHTRTGFALGAVLAAEFLKGKKGIYQMKDVMHAMAAAAAHL